MTVAKKHYRESDAYTAYRTAVEEEFGDAIWYLTALCRRLEIDVDAVFGNALQKSAISLAVAATDLATGPVASVTIATVPKDLDDRLLRLGEATADLLSLGSDRGPALEKLQRFAEFYVSALQSANVSFAGILRSNLKKVLGRFTQADPKQLPTFDLSFPKDEQIPDYFEIHVVQRSNGRCYLRWNGVFIGDPLTDNIMDRDGYRYHDVFHFAHAAVLHWSPVFRALIKHKRKSDPDVDEAQDGGRAIVVEEGLTAWVFSRAKELNYFADREMLSFDLLKSIQQFVAGYEVQECPLQLWEQAILRGYEVFRSVYRNNGGIVVGDRSKRSISYKPLD
jgi:hypothetical protein